MPSQDDRTRRRELWEVDEPWRQSSHPMVASGVEACAVCGTVRDRERLARCRWCDDVYWCADGLCAHQHAADLHRELAFWTW
jgi:hypothetical protein